MLDPRGPSLISGAFVLLMVILFFIKETWKRRRMPPGPFPLPILGNFLQIHREGLVPFLVKLGEQYGPVSTIYMGSRPTVVLTGYQAVKESMVDLGDVFLGRGSIPIFQRVYRNGSLGLANGETWKQLRQFSSLTLRDFGLGKKTLQEPIQKEAQYLVEHFASSNKEPIDPSTTMICASSNIIASVLMGTRYDYHDKKWMGILSDMHKAFLVVCNTWGQMYDILPNIMRFLPGPHNQIFRLLQGLIDVVKERIGSHRATLDPSCPRDYIDCFLIRMKQEQALDTPFHMTNLVSTVTDMFLGGAESTGITLNFGFLILVKYPEIQAKIQEEIDHVIGSREPVVEDRNQMPYMNATIHEIQRYSDTLPMGVMRRTTRDVDYRGYHIPKGTDVLPVLTTALRDPSQFETPEQVNVNHFLDENGKFKKNNGFMVFGAGKRACLGEGMVRMQLFIFLATILQKFTLKSPVYPKDLDITPQESGFETLPPDYKVMFIPRV